MGIGVAVSSCKTDFLNTQPLNQISSDVTWTDGNLSEAFVTNIYNGLGNGGLDEEQLSSMTDEAIFTHAGRGINIMNEGSLDPSTPGKISNTYDWNVMYSYIRATNISLENLRAPGFDNKDLSDRLQGEAHFLRAYYFQQIVRYYGSAPIIDRSFGLNEDYSLPRNTYEECVNFIVKDCDSAALLLGGKSIAKGRATVAAALALKSRVLTYAASDLHDVPTAKSKSTVIASYSNPELIGYVNGDRTARWTAARDAAKAAMDAGGGGYMLNLTAPASKADAIKNYTSIAMGGGSKSTEVDPSASIELLFARNFTPDMYTGGPGGDGTSVGLDNGPNGYHNWAGNTPIQQMVDDYEMMDGTKFSWSNAAQKAKPYENRDPRFYATILYDGASWKTRSKITSNPDPVNQIQSGKYQMVAGGAVVAGLDTRQSVVENWNGSWTGYYQRKFIDVDDNVVDNNTRQFLPWPILRYTEVVFNYIEALIELHQDAEAQTWLNKIRFRAGMPAVTETGTALRDRYRNERRVEMAYEEQRYHDARRWMIAPTTLGRKCQYISVTGMLKPGAVAPANYKYDPTIYNYTYAPFEDNSLENRKWVDKMYFRPIVRDEMNKNQKLIQNPGY